MDRRGFLWTLGGLALGGAWLGRRAHGATAESLRGVRPAPQAGAVAAGGQAAAVVVPLADLQAGERLGGATVAGLRPVERGAIPVEVVTERGRLFRVEVLARDPSGASPAPVAETASLALYVVNGGRGDRATPADVVEATRALAATLAQREAEGHPFPSLPRFAERPSGIR